MEEKTLVSRLVGGGAWSFSSKLLTGFLTIALTGYIAKHLPPEEVGIFFFSFSVVAILSLFARLGLDQLAIKLIGEALVQKDRQRITSITLKSIAHVLTVSLVLSLVLASMVEHLAVFDGIAHARLKLLIALWLPVFALQLLFAEIFRAFHNIKLASIYSGGTAFGGFLGSLSIPMIFAALYILGFPLSLSILISSVIFVIFISLLTELVIIRRLLHTLVLDGPQESSEKLTSSDLVKNGLPLFIAILASYSLMHVDVIILGVYGTNDEVAVYAATSRIAKLAFLVVMVVNEVVAPLIVQFNTQNRKSRLEAVMRGSATLATYSSLIVSFVFIFFAEKLLQLIYGDFYTAGSSILVILGVGLLFSSFLGSGSYAMNLMGYAKVRMVISFVTTFVAIVMCVFAAQHLGPEAVALVIAMAWVAQNLASNIFLYKVEGIRTHAFFVVRRRELRKLL
jgi:O-antigen/teichoic acid export membrane protein